MAAASVRPRDFVHADLVGGALAACALTLLDVVATAGRSPDGAGVGLALLACAAWPLGALLATLVLVPRGLFVRHVRERMAGGVVCAGAADATGLFALAVYAQDPRVLADANLRALVLGACVLLGGAVGWGWARWLWPRPKLARVVAWLVVAAIPWALGQLRWNGDPWFRTALHVVFAVALARAVQEWALARRGRHVVLAVAALALVGLLAWAVVVPRSMPARLALYQRASAARTWAYVVERVARPRSVAAPRPMRAVNLLPRTTGAGHGVAPGSDVFLFSVDSLRWDAVDQLAPLREALGPHVNFGLAVSPAPATRDSLAATLRGRAVSELVIEPAPGARGEILWHDPSPTLGHVLSRAGYRAVTIPAHNQADPRLGIHSGFDTVWPVNHDALSVPLVRSPFKLSYTPGHEIVPAALQLARNTPGPLLLWIHFMEPHYSYHWSPTEEGPRGLAAYRRAVRYEAELLAGLVKDLRAIRARPAITAVFGDHGEEFREHGGDFHGTSVYAEQARVAFLLASPGVRVRRVTTPVSTAALPATVLELLGLAVPASMTVPALPLGGGAGWPTLAVTELRSDYREAVGYTIGAWRLVRDARHDIDQLFDVAGDPYERRDLSGERPSEVIQMRQLARRWHAHHRLP